jgi:hypothetical protein
MRGVPTRCNAFEARRQEHARQRGGGTKRIAGNGSGERSA